MKNLKIIISIVSILLSTNIYSGYKTLEEHYLPTTLSQHNFTINKQTNTIAIPKTNKYESSKIILKILKQSKREIHGAPETLNGSEEIINSSFIEDLSIFHSNKIHFSDSLFSKINNTRTNIGEIMLAKILINPSTQIEKLQKRQRKIKNLLENENQFKEIDRTLLEIRSVENEFWSLWKEFDLESQKILNELFYFDNDTINQNSTALQAWFFAQLANTTILPVASNTLHILLAIRSLIKLFNNEYDPIDHNRENNNLLTSIKDLVIDNPFVIIPMAVMRLMRIKSTINTFNVIKETSFHLQEKMIKISSLLNSIKKMETKINLKSEETLSSETFNVGEKRINSYSQSKKTKKLLKLLNSKTLRNKPSLFANHGKALTSFVLIMSLKDEFVSSMKTIGKIDAYLSIAKLYKKNSEETFNTIDNKKIQYCFPEYIESDTPKLNLINCWNPFLKIKTSKETFNVVVPNNIILGLPNNSNMLITGPNAAGKSTILKSIPIASLLAQTIGIAPASEALLTPFSKMHSYLNIVDTTGKESLFEAEMHRAKELIDSIKGLEPKKFCLIIMDEIFSATKPTEGEASAYAIARTISNYTNNLSILSTHYDKLTTLEKDTDGKYKNFKVSAIKNDNGSFNFPYKLEEGYSTQNIALELLDNEGFESEILEYAYQLLTGNPSKS